MLNSSDSESVNIVYASIAHLHPVRAALALHLYSNEQKSLCNPHCSHTSPLAMALSRTPPHSPQDDGVMPSSTPPLAQQQPLAAADSDGTAAAAPDALRINLASLTRDEIMDTMPPDRWLKDQADTFAAAMSRLAPEYAMGVLVAHSQWEQHDITTRLSNLKAAQLKSICDRVWVSHAGSNQIAIACVLADAVRRYRDAFPHLCVDAAAPSEDEHAPPSDAETEVHHHSQRSAASDDDVSSRSATRKSSRRKQAARNDAVSSQPPSSHPPRDRRPAAAASASSSSSSSQSRTPAMSDSVLRA